MADTELKTKILENIIVTPKKQELSVPTEKEQKEELLKKVLIQTTRQEKTK